MDLGAVLTDLGADYGCEHRLYGNRRCSQTFPDRSSICVRRLWRSRQQDVVANPFSKRTEELAVQEPVLRFGGDFAHLAVAGDMSAGIGEGDDAEPSVCA